MTIQPSNDAVTTLDYLAEIVDAIRRMYQQAKEEIKPLDDLSKREIEVADLLARGLDNSQIASQLIISAGTVKKHRQSIAKKWGVTEHIKPLQQEAKRRGYK